MNELGISINSIVFQLINFVLLLVILKKLMYKPVLKLLNDRKKSVEDLETDKAKLSKELSGIEEERLKVIEKAKIEANEIVQFANKDAKAIKDRASEDAYKTAQQMVEDAKAQAEAEKKEIIDSIKQDLATVSIEAAEDLILTDLTADQRTKLLGKTVNMLSGND